MPLGAWKTAEAAAVTMMTIARAAARGGGGGAIRQYSFFLCIGETGLEWSVQSVQGRGTSIYDVRAEGEGCSGNTDKVREVA